MISCKSITETDDADDLAFLANTPTQAESLLHSLEQTARGIGLHMNTNKTRVLNEKVPSPFYVVGF